MNGIIKENLDRYINLEAPEFAIVLSGKWGSGKSYFIKEYIQEQTKKNKTVRFVKISMLGIKKAEEIHRQIIVNLLNRNKKSILKAIMDLVLSIFGNKYNIELMDIPIDSLVDSSKKDIIFVFDDLTDIESISPEILTYISAFIQKYSYKIILLVDTNELDDDKHEKLVQFSHRIIGKNLNLELELEKSLKDFIDSLQSKFARDILHSNFIILKHIYQKSEYRSLKHIKKDICFVES